jgi:hypothetical protein
LGLFFKKGIESGVVAAVVKVFGKVNAITRVFSYKRILRQKPIQKDNNQNYNQIKEQFK